MLDLGYFTHRDVRIPNIDSRWAYLEQYIKEKERDCRISVLGAKLNSLLEADLDNQGVLKTDADEKWKRLVNGYTNEDKVWEGFINAPNKRSFLAYYTYHQWSIDNEAGNFSTGQQIEQVENSTTITNERSRILAYNKFVSWVAGYYQDGRISLYQYLSENKDDFPEWKGTNLCYMNVWNI